MSLDIANVIWGYGSAAADFANFAPSLALFGVGLVLFTAHYLLLRGFYALEQTRRVFWIQCAIAATNIVAALLLVRGATAGGDRAAAGHRLRAAPTPSAPRSPTRCSPARSVGSPAAGWCRFLVRLVIAVAISAAAAWGLREGMAELVPGEGKLHAALDLAVVGAGLPRDLPRRGQVLRITEVTDVMRLVTRRLTGKR